MLHQIIKMFYTCILELSTLILIYNIIKIILIYNYQFKIQFGIISVGGQDLSFCVGLKAPFTNESTFEEEKTFGKAP